MKKKKKLKIINRTKVIPFVESPWNTIIDGKAK
jgi:hypothetical protein